MTRKKLLALATGLGLAVTAMSSQAAIYNGWKIDTDGAAGPTGQTTVNEYLDIVGNSFISLNNTGIGNFTFQDTGAFMVTSADSSTILGGNQITAYFTGSGTGNYGTGFTFTGGTFNVYSDSANDFGSATPGVPPVFGANNGTLIATFDVLGGGGQVDANGFPLSNGVVTVNAKSSFIAPGYLFAPNGTDLSTTPGALGFVFTNANPVASPTATQVSEIVCEGAGWTGVGCDGNPYANVSQQNVFVSNNGQFKLAPVPEPSTVALFGVGLLVMGASLRRRLS